MDQEDNATYGGYETACKDKKPYDSRKDAKVKIKDRKRVTGAHLKPYECIYCGYWHIGHNRKKFFKRLNAGKIKAINSVDN